MAPSSDVADGDRIVAELERVANLPPAHLAREGTVEYWEFRAPADEIPSALRLIADKLEEHDQTLLAVQNAIGEDPAVAIIQVYVDADRTDA
jgi:hypothetical protein